MFKKGTKTNKKQKKVAEKKEQQQTHMKDGKLTFQKYDFEDDLVMLAFLCHYLYSLKKMLLPAIFFTNHQINNLCSIFTNL